MQRMFLALLDLNKKVDVHVNHLRVLVFKIVRVVRSTLLFIRRLKRVSRRNSRSGTRNTAERESRSRALFLNRRTWTIMCQILRKFLIRFHLLKQKESTANI